MSTANGADQGGGRHRRRRRGPHPADPVTPPSGHRQMTVGFLVTVVYGMVVPGTGMMVLIRQDQ